MADRKEGTRAGRPAAGGVQGPAGPVWVEDDVEQRDDGFGEVVTHGSTMELPTFLDSGPTEMEGSACRYVA